MIKKILIGVVILAVIMLVGWKLFFSKNDVSKQLKNVSADLTKYHMEANMELVNNEETRSFFVKTDFKKDGEDNLFRVSLLDKNINQEQIMIRNKEGVFVLTPLLNQVYKFKGEWPLNNPKPYLYHSLLAVFDTEHDVKTADDGYIVSSKSMYPNSPNWVKQEIKFSKDLKPLWVNIFNGNNEISGKVVFTEVDMNPTFADNFFDVKANMEKSKEEVKNDSSISLKIDDLPLLPTSSTIQSTLKEQTLATVNGKSLYILTYAGDKSFTVTQSVVEPSKEITILEASGEIVDTMFGWAVKSGSYLSYEYNGVKYDFYSKTLTASEILEIANGMEQASIK